MKVQEGVLRGFDMKTMGDKRKFQSILMTGVLIIFLILSVSLAGCASAPKATPEPTLPATTVTTGEEPVAERTTPRENPDLPTTDETLVPEDTLVNDDVTPDTTIIPDTTETIEDSGSYGIVPGDPIVGTWAFANADGNAVTLTFSADGRFSGTMDEAVSSPGTWNRVSAEGYSVILTSGEIRNYRFDAETDTLYDVASPDIFITRQ